MHTWNLIQNKLCDLIHRYLHPTKAMPMGVPGEVFYLETLLRMKPVPMNDQSFWTLHQNKLLAVLRAKELKLQVTETCRSTLPKIKLIIKTSRNASLKIQIQASMTTRRLITTAYNKPILEKATTEAVCIQLQIQVARMTLRMASPILVMILEVAPSPVFSLTIFRV